VERRGAGRIGQGDRFDRDTASELLAERARQDGHGLECDHVACVPSQEMDVAAVIGADVDGVEVAAA
jgi:hypothetical protein